MPVKIWAGAETLLEQRVVVPRHICWLAQQSAEKALKAILVFLALDFPRRHDLDALRNLVPDDWQVNDRTHRFSRADGMGGRGALPWRLARRD